MQDEYILISFSHKDQQFVEELAKRLREQTQIAVWYYMEQPPGVDYVKRLMVHIEQARAVVVVLSKHSAVSDFVLSEVMHARQTQRLILPVLLETCHGPVAFYLNNLHWIDVRDGKDPLPPLLSSLKEKPNTHDHYTPLLNLPTANLIARDQYVGIISPTLYLLSTPPFNMPRPTTTEIPLCTIGRHKEGERIDILVQHRMVSRPHAFIRLFVDIPAEQTALPDVHFVIHDNATLNGTFVNGTRIENNHRLRPSDMIGLGTPDGMLTFSLENETTLPPPRR